MIDMDGMEVKRAMSRVVGNGALGDMDRRMQELGRFRWLDELAQELKLMEIEQDFGGPVREMATSIHETFETMRGVGFNREEALEITLVVTEHILGSQE